MEANQVEISEKLKKAKTKLVCVDPWYKPIKTMQSTRPLGLAILIMVVHWESDQQKFQIKDTFSTDTYT